VQTGDEETVLKGSAARKNTIAMAMRIPMKLKTFITPVSSGSLCMISPPLGGHIAPLAKHTVFARFYRGAIQIPNVMETTRKDLFL
jgi:hypothetical protein